MAWFDDLGGGLSGLDIAVIELRLDLDEAPLADLFGVGGIAGE